MMGQSIWYIGNDCPKQKYGIVNAGEEIFNIMLFVFLWSH